MVHNNRNFPRNVVQESVGRDFIFKRELLPHITFMIDAVYYEVKGAIIGWQDSLLLLLW